VLPLPPTTLLSFFPPRRCGADWPPRAKTLDLLRSLLSVLLRGTMWASSSAAQPQRGAPSRRLCAGHAASLLLRWLAIATSFSLLLVFCPTSVVAVPDFIIAGAMKAGTTDLVEDVLRPSPYAVFGADEIHYLDTCATLIRRRCHVEDMDAPGPWVWLSNGSLVAGDETSDSVGGTSSDSSDGSSRTSRHPLLAWLPEGHNATKNYLRLVSHRDDDRNCTSEGWDRQLPRHEPGKLVGDKTPVYMVTPNVSVARSAPRPR
jgi:hypothetical protein